ncbi:hypothetical protein KC851_03045 [Candidatus Kaiserbacteria bacterium]|nr:hypothetical protein [Candidatus Kaiserbacteria bacterium]
MSLAKSKKIIELYGLPGGGKTTFTKELVEQGVTLIPYDDGKLKYFTITFRYPLTVIVWLLVIVINLRVTKNFQILRYDISLLFSSLKKLHDAKRHSDTVVVVDEGLVQRLLSYSYVTYTHKQINNLLKFSPLGNLLIHVNHHTIISDRFNVAHVRLSSGSALFQIWQNNLTANLQTLLEVLESDKRYQDTKSLTAEQIVKNNQL